jgi:hypothetical protein
MMGVKIFRIPRADNGFCVSVGGENCGVAITKLAKIRGPLHCQISKSERLAR